VTAPIVPPGLQPVIAWCQDWPRHLRIVGDKLTWLTGSADRPTYYWQISLAQVGRQQATGQLLMPGDVPEVQSADGTLVLNEEYNRIDACCEEQGALYYHRDEAIHVRSAAGADRRFGVLPPPRDQWASRTIATLTWIDDRLYVVASESVRTTAPVPGVSKEMLVVWAFDRRGDLVQVFRSAEVDAWPFRVSVTTRARTLVVGFNDRGYLIDPYGVLPLPRWPSELVGAQLLPPRGVGWTATRVVEYAPGAGRLGRTLLECALERPWAASIVAVGDWYYLHHSGDQHDSIIGIRAGGSGESQVVITVDAKLADVCSDGTALCWLDPAAGAVCRAPLGPGGAPCPVVVADLPTCTVAPSFSGTGRDAPFAEVAQPAAEIVARLRHAGPVAGAAPDDLPAPTPWWGWLALALARYHQVHTTLANAVVGRSWPEGEHPVDGHPGLTCTARSDSIHVVSTAPRVYLSVRSVRDDGGLRVVPEPVCSSAYTGLAAWVAQRAADEPPAPIEARLWRWLPGRDLLAAAVPCLVGSLGGVVDSGGWMHLPPALVALTEVVAGHDLDLATWAATVGDAELAWPNDLGRRRALRTAHDALVDALLDQGAEAIVEGLPALRPGAALTAACDRLLASPEAGGNTLDAVLRTLKAHPEAPPSEVARAVTARVTARGDNRHFAICAQYLVEQGVDRDRVRAAIRLAAGVGVLAPPGASPGLETTFLIFPALIADPSVGIGLLRRLLRRTEAWQQPHAVGLLVAIRAPWCVRELRLARADIPATQRGQMDDALDAMAGTVTVQSLPPTLQSAVWNWRIKLDELTPAHRDALNVAGDRARRASFGLVPLG
jgi:hypothetical protein